VVTADERDTRTATQGRIRGARDASACDWLLSGVQACSRRAETVGAWVPDGFAAYGRILHPIGHEDGSDLRWSDVARDCGLELAPSTRLAALLRWSAKAEHPPKPYVPPLDGDLGERLTRRLAAALAAFTRTPDSCWFLAWTGYGQVLRGETEAARVDLHSFECAVLTGPVHSAAEIVATPRDFQSPTAWWPNDQAWFVTTPIDGYSTYVGATAACMAALAADKNIELLEIARSDYLDPSPFDRDP
jgi:hypothetical protein